MKKITSIEIQNFRAFYGLYEPIVLPKGENLLLYGENGSGKSSLFKALKHYFQSSRQPAFTFEVNSYATGATPIPASVTINFLEADPQTFLPISGTDQLLSFTNGVSNHNIPFVQNTDLIKGFLDYRNLLSIYLDKDPNLFDLIVSELLAEHTPIGEVEAIGTRWKRIYTVLQTTDRRHNIHWDALNELPSFESMLRRFLDRLFLRLNYLLIKYFKHNLRIFYNLTTVTFNHDSHVWDAAQNLRLELKLNGQLIADHTGYLNEARLSALAICLYLASQKENPAAFDYKILFLDDVFIGLDATNRLPILQILKKEFSDYQIFISTYDKYWYELAQRFFKSSMPNRWIFDNLYVGKEEANNIIFDKPIIIQNDDEYGKAIYYLHHPAKPDYPASANYFRKYAEEILTEYIPSHEIRNEDYSLIENHKLTNLVNSGIRFLGKIGASDALLIQLKNALPTILHPLSHFNLSSPIYKGELVEVQKCLAELKPYLITLKTRYRAIIPASKMIKLKFSINATDVGYYEIYPKEMVYLVRENNGNVYLSDCSCHAKATYVVRNGVEISRFNFNNNNTQAQYTSIANAYQIVIQYLTGQVQYSHIVAAINYATEFEISNAGTWVPLNTILVW